MNKLVLTTMIVAGMALAIQPLMANAEDAYEYAQESSVEDQAVDTSAADEATVEEPAAEQESYEENLPN
ncbi:hypothetical protein Ga0123461_2120 [Mariprofundus aestuarium]|uniref:Uncharacterized protein n=1 Tax=Mariprofundus aestuarium TaxID=1921086 RepID=A0A2K8L8D0_MARES|nr:hypothetical protein [Mariprofundus aestuarium]ATX80526.1 hypothetical protein Ga0123461_2120 [Mariprofundus aestuarium]